MCFDSLPVGPMMRVSSTRTAAATACPDLEPADDLLSLEDLRNLGRLDALENACVAAWEAERDREIIEL